MIDRHETLAARIDERFEEQMTQVESTCGELTYEVAKGDLIAVATALRNEADFGFEMLMDVCGVDYLDYGSDEWNTDDATATANQQNGAAAAQGLRPDARATVGGLDGLMRQWWRLLSLFLFRGSRLRSHRTR